MLASSALKRNLKFRKLSTVLCRVNYKTSNDNSLESDFLKKIIVKACLAAYQKPIIIQIAKDMT